MPKRISRAFFCCILLLTVSLIWAGCSQEEIKKSENASRIRTLFDALDASKKNYELKNSAELFDQFGSRFPDAEQVKKEIREVYSRYTSISLRLYVDHVVLDKENSSMFVRWEGEWKQNDDERFKSSGTSIFNYSTELTPHLVGIQGTDPFTAPVRERRS